MCGGSVAGAFVLVIRMNHLSSNWLSKRNENLEPKNKTLVEIR